MSQAPAPLSGVLEAALYVADLERAARFYGRVLGLPEVLRLDGRHVFFRCGDTILLIFDADAAGEPGEGPLAAPSHGSRGPGHVCFAARASQLTAWEASLQDMGIDIERRIVWPNGAKSIYFRDPDGNSLEIAEPKLWADRAA